MKKFLASAVSLALIGATLPVAVRADGDEGLKGKNIRHVLLVSVDGLHALDLANYVNTHGDSTLAGLSRHGITYTNDSTSSPSDSFPGWLL